MIDIIHREAHPRCEVWLTRQEMDEFYQVAYLLQELGINRLKAKPQKQSDLDLETLPLYVCKVPSMLFFPYITYRCANSFTRSNNFIIPKTPWNRIDGSEWLNALALPPEHLVNPEYSESKYRNAWFKPDGNVEPESILTHAEIISLATAVKSYLLDEIRYVYDAEKSILDGSKTSRSSRYSFKENVANFDSTRQYLEWYISVFNTFFTNLLEFGRKLPKEKSASFLVATWTINRLAADMLTLSSTDVPYVRKWQFFSFLDALANLLNELTTQGSSHSRDAQRIEAKIFEKLLKPQFFQNEIMPVLNLIPVSAIRDEVIAHTQSIYETIESMGTEIEINNSAERINGQELLRAYRNSRHGFAIKEKEKNAIIAHSGKIPDDLPDLGIALWHYLLLKFPFSDLFPQLG